MEEAYITIRQMCDAYDVTARTLRFYEAKELLHPVRQGQRRLFTRSDRARLTLILRGKRFGFSLEELRQLLDLYSREDGRRAQLAQTTIVARKRLAEMEAQRDDLDAAILDLRDQLSWIDRAMADDRSTHAA